MAATPSVAGSTDPAFPEDAIEVGRVVDAWGVKGWIKVQPFASDPQALFSSKRWFVKPPEEADIRQFGTKPAASFPHLLKVTEAKEHGDGVVAQVQEVSDRTAAEALRGARLFVGRSSFPTADADEYYWVDLIGLSVVNRQGDALGTVIGLLDTGPHSVLRIQPADAKAEERLVPFVAAYVDDVNLAEKRITVDWGLDY
ncbi:MAG: ribosome maturation factor RimM [Rhizobacter sp.]|nr:ribosome maturation factor RimM [Rhizobacter sp.]